MVAPLLRASFLRPEDLVVDLFAGAGGASIGIEEALGRPVDIAINHKKVALDVHQRNHPETRHIHSDIWEVDPRAACGSRRVGLLWASPDCRHFSRAKGGKPRSARVRSLAWVVVRWAREVQPAIIIVENVEEFGTWGPLDEHGRPRADKVGRTFRAWCGQLSDLGYTLDFRTIVAADYGAPTIRKRLFIVATRGAPIVWPEPTHGPGLTPYRTAAECIDWSDPCVSIFGRPKPLADATLRRIAAGLGRYAIDAQPFILPVTHGADRSHPVCEPFRTVTAAHRGEFALCRPFIVRHGHYSRRTGAGLVPGCGAGTFRGQSVERPFSTVCATDDRHLVLPVIVPHYGGATGHPTAPRTMVQPLPTVTAKDHTSLVAAWLTKYYGTAKHGASLRRPMPTVTASGGRGGGHLGLVRAFLTKWYSAGGRPKHQNQRLDGPLHTIPTKDRFGLVTVLGEDWEIQDIGTRMLRPRELAAAQGFPDWYDLSPAPTKTEQTALIGNSVCWQVAEAIITANVGRAPDQRRLFVRRIRDAEGAAA
jgi:DNA (cytosine-5)-methyltransferase 1